MVAAGLSLALLRAAPAGVVPTLALLAIVAAGAWAALAVFWTIPPACLSDRARAGGIAFASSAGAIGGFVSPVIIGWSSELTGSLSSGLAVIGAMLVLSAASLLACVTRRTPAAA